MPTLQPTVSACWSYTPEDSPVKATIVVSPIRIEEERGRIFIFWACSRRNTCRDYECLYARAIEAPSD